MKDVWERDASDPREYHVVEAKRGREFILRLTTGADVYLAIQQFAKDKGIRFAKVHCSFMGGFKPAKMLFWTPDPHDPGNWHTETTAVFDNMSMVISMNGVIPGSRRARRSPSPPSTTQSAEPGTSPQSAATSPRAPS
jgi:hypothetical protein